METPRLGVKSEMQLLAYTTAIAVQEPSHICNLYHSSWQQHMLNPPSVTRDQTRILMDTSHVLNPLSHDRNPPAWVLTLCFREPQLFELSLSL